MIRKIWYKILDFWHLFVKFYIIYSASGKNARAKPERRPNHEHASICCYTITLNIYRCECTYMHVYVMCIYAYTSTCIYIYLYHTSRNVFLNMSAHAICKSTHLHLVSSALVQTMACSQTVIWINAHILLIRQQGIYFNEILFEIPIFSFKKMHLNMSSAKWRPFIQGRWVKWSCQLAYP